VPIFWYITAANFADHRIRAGVVGDAIVSLRLLLVGATYLIVIGLIFVRWSDFWLSGSL
jgi:hypothetical protein